MLSINTNYITASISGFELVKATETSKGSLNVLVKLVDKDNNSSTLEKSYAIGVTEQSISTVKDLFEKALENFKASNNTKEKDILDTVLITNQNIKITISDFRIDMANENKSGKVIGNILISDSITSVIVPVDLKVEQLKQSASTVKSLIEKALENFVVTNEIKPEYILSLVYISNENITLDIKDFLVRPSNDTDKGLVSGIISIYDNSTESTEEITINKEIDLLNQEISTAVRIVQKIIYGYNPTNNSTFEDLLRKCNDAVTKNIDVYYKIGDQPVKVDSTEFQEGYMNATMVVTDGVNSKDIPFEITILKLPQTLSGAETLIKYSLNNFKATNATTKQDVLNEVNINIRSSDITVVFGPDEEEFNKEMATVFKEGKITGMINISDSIDTIKIPVILEIEQLPQTIEEAEKEINDMLLNFKANNNTEVEDIKNAIEDVISSNIEFEIKDFKKDKATDKNIGKINGNIVITNKDVNESKEIPLSLIIEKLSSSSSGGSGGIEDNNILNIGSKISSIEQLTSMLQRSSISILGISRDNLLSDVKLDQLNTVIENNSIEFDGVNTAISKVELSYTEIKGTDGTITNGDLSVLIADNSVIGVGIKGKDKYGENASIKISTNLSEEELHIYTNIKDVDKYIEVKDKSNKTKEGITLDGINSDNYLISTKSLSEKKQANIGWYKNENNEWSHINNYDTEKGWMQDKDSNWYFNDLENGKMQTGWMQSPYSDKWYYLNEKSDGTRGKMQTGWNQINDFWYYLNSDGSMATDWIMVNESWYYLNSSGAMQTGWIKDDDSNWYYFYSDGTMALDTYIDGYYVNSGGALAK